MRPGVRALVSFVMIVTAACGAPANETTDAAVVGDAEVVTLHDFFERTAHVGCGTLYGCCDAAERSSLHVDASDAAACEVEMATTTDRAVMLLSQSIASGRARFDPARAAACLDQVEGASCEHLAPGFGRGLVECPLPLVPLVAIGGLCTDTYECIDGSCPPSLNGSPARCAPIPAIGEACTGTCGDGAFCDVEAGLVCHALLAAGAPCTMDVACQSGLYCPNRAGMARTCAVLDRCLGH